MVLGLYNFHQLEFVTTKHVTIALTLNTAHVTIAVKSNISSKSEILFFVSKMCY